MAKIQKLICINCDKIVVNGKWLFSRGLYKYIQEKDIQYPCRDLIPVILQEKEDYYDLIWGYEILYPILNTQQQVIGLCVDVDEVEKGLINLCLLPNYYNKKENLVVCARYFYEILPKEEHRDYFYKIFSYYIKNKEIDLILKWMRLPCCFDTLALSGNIPLDIVSQFLKFTSQELSCFIPFFEKLKWGKNKAKIFLELVFQLSKGRDLSIQNILNPLAEILNKDLSPNDKIQSILNQLRDMRYPYMRKFEQEFNNKIKDIFKDHRIKIRPSQGFETDDLVLEISLDRSCSIKEVVQHLMDRASKFDEFYFWYVTMLNG